MRGELYPEVFKYLAKLAVEAPSDKGRFLGLSGI